MSLLSGANFVMDPTNGQRVHIKFCVNLGKSVTETLAMITHETGEESMSHTQAFQWHTRFTAGRTSTDDQHTGMTISSIMPDPVAKLIQLDREDRRQTMLMQSESVMGHAN
jgi:hypothetical protein